MPDFLIVRLSSLGDIVHTIPAYAALRRVNPKARIRWVVEKKGKEILDFVSGLDEIIVRGERGWRKRLRGRDQIALDFQGLLKSALIARLSGAKKRLGFHKANLREPAARRLYTDRLDPVSESGHVIAKNLSLLRLIGIEAVEQRFEFPLIIPEDLMNSVCNRIGPAWCLGTRELVVFNVGAAWTSKRWDARNWIALLNILEHDHIHPLLLWGTEEERAIAERIKKRTEVAMAPFLTVRETMALLKKATLVVSGDTFALQAACALGGPVVGLFGPTNPNRNGPFQAHDGVIYHEIECSRCYKHDCESMDCMKLITPEEVAEKVRAALKVKWKIHRS
jgi:lipopolysaccharide heptosyltransferase I